MELSISKELLIRLDGISKAKGIQSGLKKTGDGQPDLVLGYHRSFDILLNPGNQRHCFLSV